MTSPIHNQAALNRKQCQVICYLSVWRTVDPAIASEIDHDVVGDPCGSLRRALLVLSALQAAVAHRFAAAAPC